MENTPYGRGVWEIMEDKKKKKQIRDIVTIVISLAAIIISLLK